MSGHIRKRNRGDGSVGWQVRLPGHAAKTFDKKGDAVRWLADRQAAALRGDLISPTMQVMTVAELAAEWRATWPGRLQPTSCRRYDELLALYVLPSLGAERAATLSYLRVSRFLANLPDSLSASTVRKIHATLSAVFTEGIRAGYVRVNPCRHQRLPRVHRCEPLLITTDETERIAAQCGDWGLAVRLAIYTGLRAGEQWALRWGDIDGQRLIVRRALKSVGGRLEFGPTKTHQSRRVSLPSFLVDELEKRKRPLAAGFHPDDLIFRGAYGSPIRHNLFVGRVFQPAVRKACPNKAALRWHDLRHSHGSHLLALGVPVHVVKERLGHASITTTVDVYGHLMPGADEDVARLLDGEAA